MTDRYLAWLQMYADRDAAVLSIVVLTGVAVLSAYSITHFVFRPRAVSLPVWYLPRLHWRVYARAIIITGAVLRVWQFDQAPLWYDEIGSAWFASLPWP